MEVLAGIEDLKRWWSGANTILSKIWSRSVSGLSGFHLLDSSLGKLFLLLDSKSVSR